MTNRKRILVAAGALFVLFWPFVTQAAECSTANFTETGRLLNAVETARVACNKAASTDSPRLCRDCKAYVRGMKAFETFAGRHPECVSSTYDLPAKRRNMEKLLKEACP